MRRGPLRTRHLVVAVLVVLVVNAQLTWWIVFVLGQNRARLELERQRLLAACRVEHDRMAGSLAEARSRLLSELVGGAVPAWDAPPAPFAWWQRSQPAGCASGWLLAGSDLLLRAATATGCVEAAVDAGWRDRLLEVPAHLHVVPVDQDSEGPPAVGLPEPFQDFVIQPTAGSWHRILKEYRGRIAMMVSEGSFFAILLFVLIGLLVRTLRREAELERRHRNFLSAITHELKSPLASMRLALETVLAGRADEATSRRFLDNALDDAGRLEELVQKVLQVARYDRGAGRLELGRGSVSGVVRRALEIFERRARSAGARLDSDIRDGVWARINDEALAIAVSNLLENAVKYGGVRPEVGVRLSVHDGRAVLDVSDSGEGIAADDVSQVFERFYRGGDEMTRTSNGTGLGLYLVRQIVAAHRGTVEIAETGPAGTTLRVTLPDAEVREGAP